MRANVKPVLKLEVFRKWVFASGHTNESFAEAVGSYGNIVSDWLAGRSQPSAKMRRQILDVIALPFDDLFEIVEG